MYIQQNSQQMQNVLQHPMNAMPAEPVQMMPQNPVVAADYDHQATT